MGLVDQIGKPRNQTASSWPHDGLRKRQPAAGPLAGG
jgi:hypothetical protein